MTCYSLEYTKNPNYGRFKCFHCLSSPDGDDPIFIAKGLNNDLQERGKVEYPCQVVNRFQCPYERTNNKKNDSGATNPRFEVEDLFTLQHVAFVIEMALAKARKDDSKIQIRDKQDLLHTLTDRDTFVKILEQADDSLNNTENQDVTTGQDNNNIVDYFMKLKNYLDLNELRF